MPKPKVIIIGSGLAGLSAGLELANDGYEITIHEASSFMVEELPPGIRMGWK